MRHQKLLDKVLEASDKVRDKRFDLWLAEADYEAARAEYDAALEEDERRKQEMIEIMEDGVETHEERIMFILENQEELLELFFPTIEQINYNSRQIDNQLTKIREEMNKPKRGYKEILAEMDVEEEKENAN